MVGRGGASGVRWMRGVAEVIEEEEHPKTNTKVLRYGLLDRGHGGRGYHDEGAHLVSHSDEDHQLVEGRLLGLGLLLKRDHAV